MVFPRDFLWGAATAATQIEGAAHEDGKTDSIWDHFSRVPGAVVGGDTPEVACDHYHRMPEDVQLIQSLGLGSYRFSVNWSRIKPDDGALNRSGIDFYSRLVDRLLEAGVLPWLTLYHWDLPQALQERGGWTNRDLAPRFADYAATVFDALGDRVTHWTTFNEPWCSTLLSYGIGEHAPGIRNMRAATAAVHQTLRAHGHAVAALRELGAETVGITLNLTNALPEHPDDPADVEAARFFDGFSNRIFLDPLLRGSYADDVMDDFDNWGLGALVQEGDLTSIRQPLDFLGVNYYHDDLVSGHGLRDMPDEEYGGSAWLAARLRVVPRRLPHTDMGWEVNAEGLRVLLNRLQRDYGTQPFYVTENGAAYPDQLVRSAATGAPAVHDNARIEFLQQHFAAAEDAIADGVDLRGFFVWSLMDNYEWALGYGKRFGLVHVDYQTQTRTPKDSALFYRDFIAAQR